ncbi:MAG: hypothetical protein JXR78_04360 [Victivallales bacterium]|nr:hypothetical protein [Victivallales bacterium]
MRLFVRVSEAVVLCVLLALFCGCATPNVTNTPRSGIEKLVISTAADRSIVQLDEVPWKSSRVYVDFTYLACTDVEYVKGCIRQRLGINNVMLVDSKKDSDLIVEVFSGAMDTDYNSFLLGVPPVAVPVPFAGTVQTPEIAFYKRDAQSATSKLGLSVIDSKNGKLLHHLHNLTGFAFYNRYSIIGIFSWNATDIPKQDDIFVYNME